MNALIILLVSANTASAIDPVDTLISAAILLFILSTITEKLTDLIRMYPVQFRIVGALYCLFLYFQIGYGIVNEPSLGVLLALGLFVFNTLLFFVIIGNTTNAKESKYRFKKLLASNLSVFNNVSKNSKGGNPKEKEREVTALSYMVGLIVAFLFNANLFNFFDVTNQAGLKPLFPFAKSPYPFFALDPDFFKINIVSAIGLLLTGFFLAFGAKFFHDLLDNLLQIKNLKRKANEKADWDFNNITEFDNYINLQEQNLFEQFLKAQLSQPGVFYESDWETKSVLVHLSDSKIAVPEKLYYKSSLGKIVEIKIEKKESLAIKTLGRTIYPSSELANELPYQNSQIGTLGYFVKALHSNNAYLLTCFHVIWNGHNWDQFRPIGREKVVHPIHGGIVGEVSIAVKNTLVDAVLINPIDISLEPLIDGIGTILTDRELGPGDRNRNVRMRGNISGNKEGYISELNKEAHIVYPDGTTKSLNQLFVIKSHNNQPFSVKGDSGSLVVDDVGYAVGMIVAGNEMDISLAIPFSLLKSQLNIEIYKKP